jgi:regulator of protease activity HflC (stomatin/prohibitin superfamily)
MITDNYTTPTDGKQAVLIQLILTAFAFFLFTINGLGAVGLLLLSVNALMLRGYFVVAAHTAVTFYLFGKYKATVKNVGFYWTNPFYSKQRHSLKKQIVNTPLINITDKNGDIAKVSTTAEWQIVAPATAFEATSTPADLVIAYIEQALRTLFQDYVIFADNPQIRSLNQNMSEALKRLHSEVQIVLIQNGIEITSIFFREYEYLPEFAEAMRVKKKLNYQLAAKKASVQQAILLTEATVIALKEKSLLSTNEAAKDKLVTDLLCRLCSTESND